MSTNRAEAVVNLSAIASNVRTIKARAGVPVMAVVKADAYGHGLLPVARTAIDAGAQWLGVALLEEALTIRTGGITAPTIAWLVPPGSDFASAISADIDLGVGSLVVFHEISEAGRKLGRKARIHIEVDTGMTRGGFLSEWESFLEVLEKDSESVEVIGIFSHFARADEPGQPQNVVQLKRFTEMADDLNRIGIQPEIHHLSNSAATLVDASSHFDLVRVGIAMYGLTPDLENLGTSQSLGLIPAMTLRAKLNAVKPVLEGTPVGYGAIALTAMDTTVGVVSMGYADGIPRIAQGAGVYMNGRRCPIIGRVSMDQFVVDLGPDTLAVSGDWVTIFGPGTEGEYTADDWGRASLSINYEIVTRIGPRVPRIYEPVTTIGVS